MTSTVLIEVNAGHIAGRISSYLTGACMEDVNHEVYGGIYSQMLFGESFEEEPLQLDARISPSYMGLTGTVSSRAERFHLTGQPEERSWLPFRRGSAEGNFQATVARARRGWRSQMIEFCSGEGEVGIENQGLNRWGLNLLANQPYEGFIIAWAEEALSVHVALESADGTQVYTEQILALPGDEQWHRLSFILSPSITDVHGRFAIKLIQPGAVWVDYALLQPGAWGRYKETQARRDIGEGLVSQGLSVLRYGGYMINTDWEHELRVPGSGYRWKKMIGPREDRPPYLGTFYPYNSNGFGLIDFVDFCEAAGFLCVPVISPSETPDDVADLMEYLEGTVDTPWGRRRAENGHAKPYGLRFLQIGNEENTRETGGRMLIREDYPDHFSALLNAAVSRSPDLTVVMSPWLYHLAELDYPENRERMAKLLQAARGHHVLLDVHVGGDDLRDADATGKFLPELCSYLDDIDPSNQVRLCILEENGVRHDLQRALGHAHHICTIERMGALVQIDCAANCLQPYGQHDNGWDQGQLFFTPGQVWGMPPYYAQQMIARHFQPLCVDVHVRREGRSTEGDTLDVTATRSEDGRTVVLKVVNLGLENQPVEVNISQGRAGRVTVTHLTGELTAENTPEEPCKVAPVDEQSAWDGGTYSYVVGKHSFTIMQFRMDAVLTA